jgi:hypothetical protein
VEDSMVILRRAAARGNTDFGRLSGGLPVLVLILALVVTSAPPSAQARDLRHHGDEASARADEERYQEHGRPTAFAAFIDEMIQACGGQAAALRKLPPETIVQVVQLSDDQRAALDQIRTSADSDAKTLDANCPKRIPAELGAKLDTLDHALSLVADSLSGLRPSVFKFYALLDDEQKGRLVGMRVSGSPASRFGKDSASASGADAEAKSICAQWVANLRTWPVRQIDVGMQLSDTQRAALYELSAAIYRLAGQACPADNPVTVPGRLDARQNELQAVRRDIEAMRPSATTFENALKGAQRKVLTAAFVDEMVRACGEQAAVLRKLPPETIVQVVQLSDDQRAALEQVRASADSAAKTLDANCPKRIPAELGAKLDTLDHALSLVADSLSGLRPSILKFYALLDDEQKGRLVAMRVSGNPASRSGGKDSASASGADAEAKSICAQWVANLRTWPVRQIDAGMQLSDAQRAALYELSAAIYRSAGHSVGACPADNPVTALGRLDARHNELQAVRRDIEAMRPSASVFENALNDAQKKALTLSVPSRGQGSAVASPAAFATPSPLAPW